jgi:predicted nucleic acid-binding Zn ribbon protein
MLRGMSEAQVPMIEHRKCFRCGRPIDTREAFLSEHTPERFGPRWRHVRCGLWALLRHRVRR